MENLLLSTVQELGVMSFRQESLARAYTLVHSCYENADLYV